MRKFMWPAKPAWLGYGRRFANPTIRELQYKVVKSLYPTTKQRAIF